MSESYHSDGQLLVNALTGKVLGSGPNYVDPALHDGEIPKVNLAQGGGEIRTTFA